MTESKLLDSSIWLGYIINGDYKDVIEEGMIFTSILSLFEIKKKMLQKNYLVSDIAKAIDFIKKKSLMIYINEEISEEAAEISFKKNLGAVDALIYVSGIKNDSELITLDNDFKGLEKVRILN